MFIIMHCFEKKIKSFHFCQVHMQIHTFDGFNSTRENRLTAVSVSVMSPGWEYLMCTVADYT